MTAKKRHQWEPPLDGANPLGRRTPRCGECGGTVRFEMVVVTIRAAGVVGTRRLTTQALRFTNARGTPRIYWTMPPCAPPKRKSR